MRSVATTALRGGLLTMLALCLCTAGAQAQDAPTPLGDEFIFFVDGTNVLIPETDATVVNNPLDPGSGDKVARFGYGNWAHSGFRWQRGVGIDASANVSAEAGAGDTLYLKLLSDPANAGQPNVWLMFTDKTDDSGASRDDLESGAATADHEFRLTWTIPQEMHDGQWHDLAIPLPPTTLAALDSAKVGKKADGSALGVAFDDMAANWDYPGAWTNGGYGVGPGFGTSTEDPLWREFEWDAVKTFGVMFDNNTGGGPLYFDDMYIGGPGTDPSVATNQPAAMSGVTFTAGANANVISWTHNAEFGGYNVYTSLDPITDVSDDGVALLQSVPFSAESFEVRHRFEVPHPSLAPMPVHYAVTSVNQFGTENASVAASSGGVVNENLPIQPYIIQLTADESDAIFDNLSTGNVTAEGFPEGLQPFEVDLNHARLGDGTSELPTETDLSADIWMGYTDANELFIYAEVTDDVNGFGGVNAAGGDTWQYDALELGWGNYDVRDVVGGSILKGSPHEDMERGEFADYQFRIAALKDAEGNIAGSSTFIGWSLDQEVQGGGTVGDVIADAQGNVTGWKILTLIPLDAIQNVDGGDVVLPPPGADELRLIPLNIALNDADETGTRESQIQWSLKNNANGQWWNSPNQWPVVAMAGRNLATAVEPVAEDLPGRFVLEQNYPNPFNPSTTIRFALPTTERVTLSVYNILGQEVATLINGQTLSAGSYAYTFDASQLASGVYLYRVDAGTAFQQTRRMLLVK